MEKIIIIGCPGSGKSTFGRALAKFTGLPLYHLDMMFWNNDKTTVSREMFLQRLKNVMSHDKWILDGNYSATMEMRLKACDTVFFLDYPTELCLKGIEERRGKPRPDMPWIETDTDDDFVEFINKYNSESRPDVIKLLEKYQSKKVVVFHSREESDKYLSDLK